MKSKRKIADKSVISPWVLTIGVLAVWSLGIFLGNIINVVTNKYVIIEENKNFWLVVIYVGVSAVVGVALAYLLTKITMSKVSEINESINKLAKGDFTVRMAPIAKNPHVNSAITNFNEMVKQLNSVALLKNDFVSSFTHEFKTPISSIKGYAELLECSENLTKEQKEYLRIIIEESKSLSALSENSLKLARLDNQVEAINKEVFSLDGQIEDCVLVLDNQLKEKGVEIELKLKPLKVKSAPYLLREVWINLLSNAIKYSEKGDKIFVKTYREKDKVVVSIKDTGIGMSEETQKHIFEKFYQADKYYGGKGLGLGLSIVKRILELVNAKIECESELGEGSEFRVCLDA